MSSTFNSTKVEANKSLPKHRRIRLLPEILCDMLVAIRTAIAPRMVVKLNSARKAGIPDEECAKAFVTLIKGVCSAATLRRMASRRRQGE